MHILGCHSRYYDINVSPDEINYCSFLHLQLSNKIIGRDSPHTINIKHNSQVQTRHSSWCHCVLFCLLFFHCGIVFSLYFMFSLSVLPLFHHHSLGSAIKDNSLFFGGSSVCDNMEGLLIPPKCAMKQTPFFLDWGRSLFPSAYKRTQQPLYSHTIGVV